MRHCAHVVQMQVHMQSPHVSFSVMPSFALSVVCWGPTQHRPEMGEQTGPTPKRRA